MVVSHIKIYAFDVDRDVHYDVTRFLVFVRSSLLAVPGIGQGNNGKKWLAKWKQTQYKGASIKRVQISSLLGCFSASSD